MYGSVKCTHVELHTRRLWLLICSYSIMSHYLDNFAKKDVHVDEVYCCLVDLTDSGSQTLNSVNLRITKDINSSSRWPFPTDLQCKYILSCVCVCTGTYPTSSFLNLKVSGSMLTFILLLKMMT